MKEKFFDNGIRYILHGDYYLPDLRLEPETRPIGRWGRMHREYLKEHRPVVFNQLVLSGNLWTYLADINEQAQQRMNVLIKQMMVSEGVTEELKEKHFLQWVCKMSNIQSQVNEIINNNFIYI